MLILLFVLFGVVYFTVKLCSQIKGVYSMLVGVEKRNVNATG